MLIYHTIPRVHFDVKSLPFKIDFRLGQAHNTDMEARRSYRLNLSGELTLTSGQRTMHGDVLNVGLSGIMAHTLVSLVPGSQYFVSFQLK